MNTATAETSTSNIAAAAGTAPAVIGQPAKLTYSELIRQAKQAEAEQIAESQMAVKVAQAAATRQRVDKVQAHKEAITEALHRYDALAQEIRGVFGEIFMLQLDLDSYAGQHIGVMPDGMVRLNLPRAFPKPMDSVWGNGFTSAQEDIQEFQQTKRWPTKV